MLTDDRPAMCSPPPAGSYCCPEMAARAWSPCLHPVRPLDEFAVFASDCGGCQRAWDAHGLPDPRFHHACGGGGC